MKNNKSAFTLIELLVVIAIIAILAAILFPVFAQAKLAAKKANDLSQLKQLGLASLMYSNDYDDKAMAVPYAGTWSTSCPGCGSATATAPTGTLPYAAMGPWWSDRLMPYVKNKGIFANPVNQDTLYLDKGYQLPGLDQADSLTAINDMVNNTAVPASLLAQEYRVTYTYNEFLAHQDDNPITPGAASMTNIPASGDTVMLGPSDNWFNRSSCHSIAGSTTAVNYDWDISTNGWGYELFGGDTNVLNGGFNQGANFAFCDGHAKYAKFQPGGEEGYDPSGSTAYEGYFPQAKTNPNFTGVGATCPATYEISSQASKFEF